MLGQRKPKPLESRVDDYLRVSLSGYEVEELGDTATQTILAELQEAEAQLAEVQQRIARLRKLLASTPN